MPVAEDVLPDVVPEEMTFPYSSVSAVVPEEMTFPYSSVSVVSDFSLIRAAFLPFSHLLWSVPAPEAAHL